MAGVWTCLNMASFEYRQAEEVREAFNSNGVRYLFLGTGAILLGFPDTTQDADVFLEKSPENGRACTAAIRSLGFDLTEGQAQEIERGKDFIQLKNGPFDLDLIFCARWHRTIRRCVAQAYRRRRIQVCNIDDIIASKEASGRSKDRESCLDFGYSVNT
jgi:hypothetical protein